MVVLSPIFQFHFSTLQIIPSGLWLVLRQKTHTNSKMKKFDVAFGLIWLILLLKPETRAADYRAFLNKRGKTYKSSTVVENHRKSLIQHCERSELRLQFEKYQMRHIGWFSNTVIMFDFWEFWTISVCSRYKGVLVERVGNSIKRPKYWIEGRAQPMKFH